MKLIKKLLPFLAILLIVTTSATGGYFYFQYQKVQKELKQIKSRQAQQNDSVTQKILNINPIQEASDPAVIQNPIQPLTTDSALVSNIKVLILNGTTRVGLTTKYEPEIKKALEKAEVVDKDNASKKDYDRTIIIATSESSKTQAQTLAKAINGSVESLPAGENQPNKGVDLVVILGKDKR